MMLTLTGVCTMITASVLILILGFLVWNGWRSLDWNFFTNCRWRPASPAEAWPTRSWAAAS